MAPPLIKKVKEKINRKKTVIIDCPPGTSCPMIAAVRGADYALLVTEPTPFGLNDLKLAVETARKLSLKFGVIINRSAGNDSLIENYCSRERIDIIMKIPFSRKAAEICSKGGMLVREIPGYEGMFKSVLERVEKKRSCERK